MIRNFWFHMEHEKVAKDAVQAQAEASCVLDQWNREVVRPVQQERQAGKLDNPPPLLEYRDDITIMNHVIHSNPLRTEPYTRS
jgi:hypothetical protein